MAGFPVEIIENPESIDCDKMRTINKHAEVFRDKRATFEGDLE